MRCASGRLAHRVFPAVWWPAESIVVSCLTPGRTPGPRVPGDVDAQRGWEVAPFRGGATQETFLRRTRLVFWPESFGQTARP